MAIDRETADDAANDTAQTHRHREANAESSHTGGGSGDDRKRKRFEANEGRAGRGNKRRDMGRKAYHREKGFDRRAQIDAAKARRENGKAKPSVLPAGFAKEEIDAEDRKPKKKVAVLIGYSGTGYRGMQISPTEKTIEGDLFTAFVKAGAISKANADDPRKSTLVRCARTDKGVHAAGNMISLKLIIEDKDIVEKINAELSPQIRVWGIERTVGSFSCYQACDSRMYEYLIPSNAFLPPHPSSFLAQIIAEYAKDVGDEAEIAARQVGVKDFWSNVEETQIKPLLETLDEDTRELVVKALFPRRNGLSDGAETGADGYVRQLADIGTSISSSEPAKQRKKRNAAEDGEEDPAEDEPEGPKALDEEDDQIVSKLAPEKREALLQATKRLKAAYDAARRSYRITPDRIKLIQGALDAYVGTRNFHNYTVQKLPADPSARRTIKSFVCNPEPILINGTEWLSLKVHGQSFMMHQIRKMVGMACLLVRAGADAPARIAESYRFDKWSVPKVPGLGLLLERPVFDSYNAGVAPKYDRESLDFAKYEDKIEAFKRTEIYGRIWEEERTSNTFHQFFNHIDNFNQPHFLYLTSKGFEATRIPLKGQGVVEADEVEDEVKGGGGGGGGGGAGEASRDGGGGEGGMEEDHGQMDAGRRELMGKQQ